MPNYVEEVMAEIDEEEKAAQTQPAQATETEPEPEHDEPKPEQTGDAPDEPPTESSEPEGQPEESEGIKPEHKEIPDDKYQRAQFSFRRQLGKTKEKYEKELKERDDKYEALRKEFEELKKQAVPKEQPKQLKREDFPDDEDFIRALQAQASKEAVEAALAERDKADAKAREEREAEDKRMAEEQENILEQQKALYRNTLKSFGDDQEHAKQFLNLLQDKTNNSPFGAVIDACPVAADYLFHDPDGPRVFERILQDEATFARVFNEDRLSPLAIYYELRDIAKEMKASAGTPAKPSMPKLGKPGKQASSNAKPDIWNDDDAMREYIRHGG